MVSDVECVTNGEQTMPLPVSHSLPCFVSIGIKYLVEIVVRVTISEAFPLDFSLSVS